MEIWIVIAVCASLKGQCAWSPPSPMPSREACMAYGRKLQLERKLPMNSFRCLKVEVKS
jgi:hypothetical protein